LGQVRDWKIGTCCISLVSIHYLRARSGLIGPMSLKSDWVGYNVNLGHGTSVCWQAWYFCVLANLKCSMSLEQLQQIWQPLSFIAIKLVRNNFKSLYALTLSMQPESFCHPKKQIPQLRPKVSYEFSTYP